MSTKETVIGQIAAVLQLDEAEIENLRKDVGYKRLKKWTSARHVEIIVAVEDVFDIEVDERSIPKLNDVAKIVAYVEAARS
ncbi:MAG TPA: acyl carrier protein [Candidatus Polarisedimenticolaceae bacterium]|nr:acyl carrier protein [Candidatus Polarisedimenticolaceae bacterium]